MLKVPFALLLTTLFLTTPAAANTIQHPNCDILGDPDVYGPGIRYGFYLQWAAVTIFQLAYPEKANVARTASAITTLAVYINTLRNILGQSLVTIDWLILFYMTFTLAFCNIPSSKIGAKKTGASFAAMLTIYAMYFCAGPYVAFKAWEHGKQPGCDVKIFWFVPVSVYSKGIRTLIKIGMVFGTIGGPFALLSAVWYLFRWFQAWGDKDVEDYIEKPNTISASFGLLNLGVGAVGIAFTEMTIKVNHITFPGTQLTDSGQIIALLIGVFTAASALLSPVRSFLSLSGQ